MTSEVKLPARVADYFCVLGFDETCLQTQDEDKAGAARDARPKQRLTIKVSLESKVLSRYPEEDWKDTEFPRDIEMFCYPEGFHFAYDEAPPMVHAICVTSNVEQGLLKAPKGY